MADGIDVSAFQMLFYVYIWKGYSAMVTVKEETTVMGITKLHKMIDLLEDHDLGQTAKERASRKSRKTVSLPEAEERACLSRNST